MVRSLYSGVSGLQSHQTKMDVIGNNIANVNTAGFKSSRVVFKDLFYQTLTAAKAPGTVNYGINPSQIGYGSMISSIDVQNTIGGFQSTDVTTDLYIAGDGFFQVQNALGEVNYTRVGNFKFDSQGFLVDSNGNGVCGEVPALSNPITDITPIQISNINDYSEIAIAADGTITGLNSVNGQIETIGQIALVKFRNPDGLSQVGNQYLKATNNSGTPIVSVPGDNATGIIVSGGLEMSNVDLSREFTDMIITQRGFQANSRVITTSDQILEELVNLKR